jgi:hypothetical protein
MGALKAAMVGLGPKVVSLWKPKKTKKPGLDEFERPKIHNHLRLPDCHFRN